MTALQPDMFSVILVPATSHALRGERVLMQAGISCSLIPLPRQISSDCGVCLRVKRDECDVAVKALVENGIIIEKTYDIE